MVVLSLGGATLTVRAQGEPAAPTTTVATTTTTKATGVKAFTKELDDFRATGGSLILSLLMVLGAVAVLVAIVRVIRLRRMRQLVVVPFTNATGQADLDKVMDGLSSLARAELVRHLDGINGAIQASATRLELTVASGLAKNKSPLPQKAADTQLTDLLTSLQSITPGGARPVVALLQQLFFPPQGMKVEGMVQLVGNKPGSLGITLEVSDLKGRAASAPQTWSEQDRRPQPDRAGPGDSPSRERPSWQTYDRVGRLFDRAGRPKEAVAYLQKAMNQSPRNVLTASALSVAAAHLETETRARTPFSLGKQLSEAGLVEEAIRYFVKPLPAQEHVSAAALWRRALSQNGSAPPGHEAGNALLQLGRRYEQNDLRLYDEALWLYQLAQEQGAPTEHEVRRLRRQATALIEAAELLREANLTKSAQETLDLASKALPDDKRVVAARARLLAGGAQEVDKAAEAARVMGALLEQREAYQEALDRYEEALTKQPDYQAAAEGVARVLGASGRTLADRYVSLLNPAMRWLALDVARDQLMRNVPRRRCKQCKAQVHNFIGVLFEAAGYKRQHPGPGREPSHARRFYELAEQEYQKAISLWPAWYQPYENLGRTLGFHADVSDDRRLELLRRSIKYLEAATSRCQDITLRRRVLLSAAVTYLLTRDPESARRSHVMVEEIRRECDPSEIRDAEFLYNLAGWYGVALALQDGNVVDLGISPEEGRRVLAYSFVRDAGSDQPYWDDALTNPDVRPLLGDSDAAVRQKIARFKELQEQAESCKELTGLPFTQAVEHLVGQVWRDGRERR